MSRKKPNPKVRKQIPGTTPGNPVGQQERMSRRAKKEAEKAPPAHQQATREAGKAPPAHQQAAREAEPTPRASETQRVEQNAGRLLAVIATLWRKLPAPAPSGRA